MQNLDQMQEQEHKPKKILQDLLGNGTGLEGGIEGFGDDDFGIGDVGDLFEDGELPPISELEEAKVPQTDANWPEQADAKGLQDLRGSSGQEEKAKMSNDQKEKEPKQGGDLGQRSIIQNQNSIAKVKNNLSSLLGGLDDLDDPDAGDLMMAGDFLPDVILDDPVLPNDGLQTNIPGHSFSLETSLKTIGAKNSALAAALSTTVKAADVPQAFSCASAAGKPDLSSPQPQQDLSGAQRNSTLKQTINAISGGINKPREPKRLSKASIDESRKSLEQQPQDSLAQLPAQNQRSSQGDLADSVPGHKNSFQEGKIAVELKKGNSLRSEPGIASSQLKKQKSNQLIEEGKKIKKKSPSQQEDSMVSQNLSSSKDADKIYQPPSSIVRAHSYQSQQDKSDDVHEPERFKSNITSAKNQKEPHGAMVFEESKENANRDSFSHPPSKLKKLNEQFLKKGTDSHDGQSDMIGATPSVKAHNTHSMPSRLDDTNSKSKSCSASNINQSSIALSNSDRLGQQQPDRSQGQIQQRANGNGEESSDLEKLLALIRGQSSQVAGNPNAQPLEVSMGLGGQTFRISLDQRELLRVLNSQQQNQANQGVDVEAADKNDSEIFQHLAKKSSGGSERDAKHVVKEEPRLAESLNQQNDQSSRLVDGELESKPARDKDPNLAQQVPKQKGSKQAVYQRHGAQFNFAAFQKGAQKQNLATRYDQETKVLPQLIVNQNTDHQPSQNSDDDNNISQPSLQTDKQNKQEGPEAGLDQNIKSQLNTAKTSEATRVVTNKAQELKPGSHLTSISNPGEAVNQARPDIASAKPGIGARRPNPQAHQRPFANFWSKTNLDLGQRWKPAPEKEAEEEQKLIEATGPLPGTGDDFFGDSDDEVVEDKATVSSKPAGTLQAILGNLAPSGSVNDQINLTAEDCFLEDTIGIPVAPTTLTTTAVAEASSAAETSSHNRLGSTNEHFSNNIMAFEPADSINVDAPGSKQAMLRPNLGSSSFDRYHDQEISGSGMPDPAAGGPVHQQLVPFIFHTPGGQLSKTASQVPTFAAGMAFGQGGVVGSSADPTSLCTWPSVLTSPNVPGPSHQHSSMFTLSEAADSGGLGPVSMLRAKGKIGSHFAQLQAAPGTSTTSPAPTPYNGAPAPKVARVDSDSTGFISARVDGWPNRHASVYAHGAAPPSQLTAGGSRAVSQYTPMHQRQQQMQHFTARVQQPDDKLNAADRRRLIGDLYCFARQQALDYVKLFNFLKQKYSIDQDPDLFEEIKKLDQIMNSRLHLAFLFASPLVMPYKDGAETKWAPMRRIDHQKELAQVIQGLAGIKNNIRYRKICATSHNWLKIRTEGTVALHFAGHGAKNNEENFQQKVSKSAITKFGDGSGTDNADIRNEGDFLIFEDEAGISQYVSGSMLKQQLKTSDTELQFVFVASCHSEKTGSIFHQAGAKHVICIRQNQPISDEAQIAFSQEFYQILFSQSRTICQAFQMAKESIRSNANESLRGEFSKFIIIRDCDDYDKVQSADAQHEFYVDQMKNNRKHNCLPLGPFNPGQIEDIGQDSRPLFKLEMSSINDFVGRATDMAAIISMLNESRLVTIIGIPGIGKTSISKSVAIFLEEREKFRDGIIYISMRRRYQSSMLISQILQKIKDQLPLEERRNLKEIGVHGGEQNQGHEENNTKARTAGPSQINGRDKEPEDSHEEQLMINQQDLDKIIYCLSSRHVLIIVDNAEDPLNNDNANFKGVLQQILDKCPQIKLLIASRLLLEQVGNVVESFHKLNELSSEESVKLFFDKSKVIIDSKQVVDLLMLEEDNEVNPVNPSEALMPVPNYYGRLMKHPLFQKLNGHPHAISMIAPMAKDHTLVEIYNLLSSKTFVDSFGNDSHPLRSLKLTLETSVKSMLNKNPKAINLWCLLGLLPGGLTEADMEKLWGSDWFGHIADLLAASLIKVSYQGEDTHNNLKTYNLLPFMDYYSWLINEDRQEQHLTICRYFSSIMFEAYLEIDNYNQTAKEKANQLADANASSWLLILHETNMWAILDRISAYQEPSNTQMKHENSDQEETVHRNQRDGDEYEQAPQGNFDGAMDAPVDRQFSRVDRFDRMLTYQTVQDSLPQEEDTQKLKELPQQLRRSQQPSPPSYEEAIPDNCEHNDAEVDFEDRLGAALISPTLLRRRSSSVSSLPLGMSTNQTLLNKQATNSKRAKRGNQNENSRAEQARSQGSQARELCQRSQSVGRADSNRSRSSLPQAKQQSSTQKSNEFQDLGPDDSLGSNQDDDGGITKIELTEDSAQAARLAKQSKQASKPLIGCNSLARTKIDFQKVDMHLDDLFNMGNDSDASHQKFESQFSSLKKLALAHQRKSTIREGVMQNDDDDDQDETRIIGTQKLASYMSDNEEGRFFYSGQNAMRFGKSKQTLDKKAEEQQREPQIKDNEAPDEHIEEIKKEEQSQIDQLQPPDQETEKTAALQLGQTTSQRNSLFQDMADHYQTTEVSDFQFHPSHNQHNDADPMSSFGARKHSQISKQYLMQSNTLQKKVEANMTSAAAAQSKKDDTKDFQSPTTQSQNLQLQIPTQGTDSKRNARTPQRRTKENTPTLLKRKSKSITQRQTQEGLRAKATQVADTNSKNTTSGAPTAPKTATKRVNATDMKQTTEDKNKNTNKKVQKPQLNQSHKPVLQNRRELTNLKIQQQKEREKEEEAEQKRRSRSQRARVGHVENRKPSKQAQMKSSKATEKPKKLERIYQIKNINGHLFQQVDFPDEGKLIIYFSSNLILSGNYDQAIRVLTQYGLGYRPPGDAGTMNFANVAKLLAIAYFYQKTSINRVEELLNQAQREFRQLDMVHGIAVCAFAKAFFFHQKPSDFENTNRNEQAVSKIALGECETAIKNYLKLKHLMGRARCLGLRAELMSKIENKDKDSNAQVKEDQRQSQQADKTIKELEAQERQLQVLQRSQYIRRCQGAAMSLLIEPSNQQLVNPARKQARARKVPAPRQFAKNGAALNQGERRLATETEDKQRGVQQSWQSKPQPQVDDVLNWPSASQTSNNEKSISSKANSPRRIADANDAPANQEDVMLNNLNLPEKSPASSPLVKDMTNEADQAASQQDLKAENQPSAHGTAADSASEEPVSLSTASQHPLQHSQTAKYDHHDEELGLSIASKPKKQNNDEFKLKKHPPRHVKRFTASVASRQPQSQGEEESKDQDTTWQDDDDIMSNQSAYLPYLRGGMQNTLADEWRRTQIMEENQTPDKQAQQYEIMSNSDYSDIDNASFLSSSFSYEAHNFQFKGRRQEASDEALSQQPEDYERFGTFADGASSAIQDDNGMVMDFTREEESSDLLFDNISSQSFNLLSNHPKEAAINKVARRESHLGGGSKQDGLLQGEAANTSHSAKKQPGSPSARPQLDLGGFHPNPVGNSFSSLAQSNLHKESLAESEQILQSRNSNDDCINVEQDAHEQEDHELQKAIKASLALHKGRFREGEDQDEEGEDAVAMDLQLIHEQVKMDEAYKSRPGASAGTRPSGAVRAKAQRIKAAEKDVKAHPQIQIDRVADDNPRDLIGIDPANISTEENYVINSLYEMYRNEPNEAERTHIRAQISQFVTTQKINYEVIEKKRSNWDPSKDRTINQPVNISANREYYGRRVQYNNQGVPYTSNQLMPSASKAAGMHKATSSHSKQVQPFRGPSMSSSMSSQRMNMKQARNMMKNKQSTHNGRPSYLQHENLYAPTQPVINEQEEEESDSEQPVAVVASNTTFKEPFEEEDKYSKYHRMVESKGKPETQKPLRPSKQSSAPNENGSGPSGKAESRGLGQQQEQKAADKKSYNKALGASKDSQGPSLLGRESHQEDDAENAADKQPQDSLQPEEAKKEDKRKSGRAKAFGSTVMSSLGLGFKAFAYPSNKKADAKTPEQKPVGKVANTNPDTEEEQKEERKPLRSARLAASKNTIPIQGVVSKPTSSLVPPTSAKSGASLSPGAKTARTHTDATLAPATSSSRTALKSPTRVGQTSTTSQTQATKRKE